MKNRLVWLGGLLLLAMIGLLGALAFRPPSEALRSAVVVELFTSEGCSSCPPADELLARLAHERTENGAEIIPLGFHVDYWDHQGWRDRFSSHAYTERQEKYAAQFHLDGPYTPQMVVDGKTQFVGSDSSRAQSAVLQATARSQNAEIQLSWVSADRLLVRVTAAPGSPASQVFLVLTEDNLSNKVAAGENDGRLLHHSAVVRDFRTLGQLREGQFQTETPIKPHQDWKKQDVHLVVFAQNSGGSIEGAASMGLPK